MQLKLIDTAVTESISFWDYDLIVVSSSGGKDSQTALDVTVEKAEHERFPLANIVVVHADLGRAEWQGTRELAKAQAEHYGLRFIAIERPQGDLLDHIEKKGKFPDSARRWCTSDHKRSQIHKVYTRLTDEILDGRKDYKANILEILGFRAEESPNRAKKVPFETNTGASNKTKRTIHTWLPIHDFTEDEVWTRIKRSGVPYHQAYDQGMKRLSCVFCIYAPKKQLELAGRLNPELLDEYVRIEKKIGHSFKKDQPISEIKEIINNTG